MTSILYAPYKSFLFQPIGTILLCRYSSTQRRIDWITRIKIPADQTCLSKSSLLLPRGSERSSNSSACSPGKLAPGHVRWELTYPGAGMAKREPRRLGLSSGLLFSSSNREGLVLLFPAPHTSLSRSFVVVRMGAGSLLADVLGRRDWK